jgi:hypothetical protein
MKVPRTSKMLVPFYHTGLSPVLGVLHYMQVMPGIHDKWVPVTTAWHVLGLRMEEWPSLLWVAVNMLNKQLQMAYKEWSSSLGIGWGANNSSP